MPDKGPPGLCLLATENAGPQPPAFGRVGQLQHHTVVFLCEPLEPLGGVRLAEVAQHDEHRAVGEDLGELIELFDERRCFVEPVVAQLMQPEKNAVPREAWLGIERPFAAADHADRAHPR